MPPRARMTGCATFTIVLLARRRTVIVTDDLHCLTTHATFRTANQLLVGTYNCDLYAALNRLGLARMSHCTSTFNFMLGWMWQRTLNLPALSKSASTELPGG